MVRECSAADLPPHVFSAARQAYDDLLSSRRDQSIVLMGESGSGKSHTLRNVLRYYSLTCGGGVALGTAASQRSTMYYTPSYHYQLLAPIDV